jgi:hypothetical protein
MTAPNAFERWQNRFEDAGWVQGVKFRITIPQPRFWSGTPDDAMSRTIPPRESFIVPNAIHEADDVYFCEADDVKWVSCLITVPESNPPKQVWTNVARNFQQFAEIVP